MYARPREPAPPSWGRRRRYRRAAGDARCYCCPTVSSMKLLNTVNSQETEDLRFNPPLHHPLPPIPPLPPAVRIECCSWRRRREHESRSWLHSIRFNLKLVGRRKIITEGVTGTGNESKAGIGSSTAPNLKFSTRLRSKNLPTLHC
ncbi:hypothetical protein EVAR_77533_1 [Eumeta japonica]|uniref:Uncharacterized protein n=1 Tax=Eumeta variegata TaxID=151549 RepID=A0A4C1T6J4_EUMVA|nr:hypothetical protein EVAR_77533_1 [Eumeta japonica]